MRKLTLFVPVLLVLIAVQAVALSDFDFWQKMYGAITSAYQNYALTVELSYEKELHFPFRLDLGIENHARVPITFSKVQFDWENAKPYTSISKKDQEGLEVYTLLSSPPKSLNPGFHAFLVEFGHAHEKQVRIIASKIDPELNVPAASRPEEVQKLFRKLQDKRVKSLDANFSILVTSSKEQMRVEQEVEGRFSATGEDKFDYTFAYIPKAGINGHPVKEGRVPRLSAKQKSGSPLRLWPLHLAYYISYDDLFNHYNWYLYKRIGPKVWMAGSLIHRDQWLPQFAELVINEKLRVPLEFSAYVYNKEFVAAKAVLEYDKNGLPIKQTLERRLPNGEQEISTLILTNLEPNKRAPQKRWFLF